MIRTLAGMALALALISAGPAWSAPPTITATTPYGVRRGLATEVKIDGTQLKGTPELVVPFGVAIASPSTANTDAGHWKVTLTVAPDTAVGVYPIRVKTEDGISNPFLFSVGQLAQIVEKEDNSTINDAQPITTPAVVEGQAAGNDVDYFRFAGKKGQRIVVDAQCARIGSGVDPSIRLTTVGGAYVASADDTPGLLTDARLSAILPEETEYVVEISDSRYQGGGRAIYRLIVGTVPFADEVYPIGGRRGETLGFELRGGTLPAFAIAAATLVPSSAFASVPLRAVGPVSSSVEEPRLDVESLSPLLVDDIAEVREPSTGDATPVRAAAPVVLNGRIDPAGDEDRFVLAVTPGQKLRIVVEASDYGSALDGSLQVLGAKGAVLATADDTAPPTPPKGKKPTIASPDPSLDFTVPTGLNEVTLSFRDLEGRGGNGFAYRIRVVPATAGFELSLDDSQVSIPRGGTAAVGVSVVRKGYNGPITVNVPSPPAGMTVRPGTIAEGQLAGAFTLSAAADASFPASQIDVVGQAQGPDGPISAAARKTIIFASQGPLATNKITQIGLAVAPSLPPLLTLKLPDSPVEIAQGAGGTLSLDLVRTNGADAALTLTTLPVVAGLSLADAKVAEKKEQASLVLNSTVEVPLGTFTIALQAKGKFAGVDQTVAAPAITLNVVRPAALELAANGIEVKAGESFELKGKVLRKGTFKEEVTVKLNKLPAGLKAEPVKLTAEQSEFTVKIESEPQAAAADAKAEVVLAFQVAKKDYPVPATTLGVKVIADKK